MKRYFSLLLVFVLLLAFTACNKQESSEKTESEQFSRRIISQNSETTTPTEVSTESSVPESSAASASEINYETDFWQSFVSDSWAENKDYFHEGSTSSAHEFVIAEGDDDVSRLRIEIGLTENPRKFRDSIIEFANFSLEDYASGVYESRLIAGIPCFIYETEGEIRYHGRNESTLTDIMIRFRGVFDDTLIDEFVDNFELLTSDENHTDPPYPWEGECYNPVTGSVEAGGFHFSAVWLKPDACFLPFDSWDNRVVFVGGYLYNLGDRELKIYTLDGETLTLVNEVTFPYSYDQLQTNEIGNVYVSSIYETKVFNNGAEVGELDISGSFAIHPSGTWGIQYRSLQDSTKIISVATDYIDNSDPFDLSDGSGAYLFKSISKLFMTENAVYVTGLSEGEDSEVKIFVYDLDGNHVRTLESADENFGLGAITGIVETPNGLIAMDGNMRHLYLWNTAGECIGKIDDGDLFGTRYPWMSGFSRGDDGNIYACMMDYRPDNSWDEMLVYRIDTDF